MKTILGFVKKGLALMRAMLRVALLIRELLT